MRIPRFLTLIAALALVGGSLLAQDPGANPPAGPPPGGGAGGHGGGQGGGHGGGRPNFNPEQMREQMLNRMKEQLGATDEEWQVIKPRLQTVMEKQRASRELQSGMGGFRGGPGGPPGGPQATAAAEVTAVEKAIEGKDAAAIKTAVEALRKARTARQAELDKAKAELQGVLTVAQEARLVLMGMLD